MSIFRMLCIVVLISACASLKSGKKTGDTRTKPVASIDDHKYLLLDASVDPTYAFTQSNPVKVGSEGGSGPANERRYLNALLGPNGEQVHYLRSGSCCPFKTPNGLLDNTGLLDHYKIYWGGSKDTLDVYINMYDRGDLWIPVGMKSKSKN